VKGKAAEGNFSGRKFPGYSFNRTVTVIKNFDGELSVFLELSFVCSFERHNFLSYFFDDRFLNRLFYYADISFH